MTGTLIALEGIDGSGKTTICERLQERYSDEDVVFTREPTRTWYGDAVLKSVNDDEADELAELFLYTADHAAHLQDVIQPALEADKTVITDRYVDSRLAYQAVTLAERFGADVDPLEFVKSVHEPWTRCPDCTVYLDISPETGARRSGETNKMEQKDHLASVYDQYDRLRRETDRFTVVDGEEDAETVFEAVVEVTDPLVGQE